MGFIGMSKSKKRIVSALAIIISLSIVYGLLIVGELSMTTSTQTRFELPEDSPEAQALNIIQNEVNPRSVAQFGINGDMMTVTYPIKDSNYLGNISLIASEMELLRISCQLRDAGYIDRTYQFLITMPTKEGEQVDGYAIALEDDTVAELDCVNLQDVSVSEIADQYDFLYLEDTKDSD